MAIIDAVGYSKVCARWVSRSLTTEHRRQRKAICSELLESFDVDGEAFLSQIVTGDETWAHHYEPETKWQSMEWHHPQSPRRSSGQLLPPARSWSPSFGTLMEWFWWMWWPEVRQSIRTRTSDPSKNWNSVTGECGLTGIQETCWFSTTMPALTQVYEPRRQSPNFVRLSSPIPPIVLIWRRQIFFYLFIFLPSEGCTAWDKVWRWRKRDSCSEDMATWTGNELVQRRHACPCFALA